MLFSGSRLLHHLALNAYRVLLGALVLAAATLKSTAPMYAAEWLVGMAILGLPLRAFRTARLIATLLWTASLGLAAADYEGLDAAGTRALVTLAVIALVLGATATIAFEPRDLFAGDRGEDGSTSQGFIVRSIAASLVLGVALMLAVGLDSTWLGTYVVHSPALKHVALVLGLAALAGTVTAAASGGLLRGIKVIDRTVRRPPIVAEPTLSRLTIRRPRSVRRPTFRGSDFPARFAYAINVVAVKVAQRLTDALNVILKIAAQTILRVKKSFRWLVNGIHRTFMLCARGLRAALVETARVLREAVLGALPPIRRFGRSSVTPVTVLGAGAALAVYAGHLFTGYLVSGGVGKGFAAIGLTLTVAGFFVLVWWAVTGWPWDAVSAPALRLLERAGPTLYVLVLALAWANGILGWAGVGPIRPGWLTFGGTALLALVYIAGQKPGWFGLSQETDDSPTIGRREAEGRCCTNSQK